MKSLKVVDLSIEERREMYRSLEGNEKYLRRIKENPLYYFSEKEKRQYKREFIKRLNAEKSLRSAIKEYNADNDIELKIKW